MTGETFSRIGDMHPNRALQVHVQNNGDVIVSIIQDGMVLEGDCLEDRAVIEFCVSGGRSPHTLAVLHQLAVAIKEDTKNRKIEVRD